MFCKQCGAKIEDESTKFCPICGVDVKSETPKAKTVKEQPAKEQPVVVNVTNQNTNVNSLGIPQKSKWVAFFFIVEFPPILSYNKRVVTFLKCTTLA